MWTCVALISHFSDGWQTKARNFHLQAVYMSLSIYILFNFIQAMDAIKIGNTSKRKGLRIKYTTNGQVQLVNMCENKSFAPANILFLNS